MDISTYLKKHNMSQAAFGEKLGVSQGLVWQWIAGHTRVTAERAIQIHQATKGSVKKSGLRPDLFAK